MATSKLPPPRVSIRELSNIDDFKKVQSLERTAWDLAEIDVMPLSMAVATHHAGALWLGAFDGNSLAGFAFAFPGIRNEVPIMHSHKLAVHPGYRDRDIGYQLKVTQRERVMAIRLGKENEIKGLDIREITWTFDPLQSKNAYLNLAKLGALAREYRADLYGPETSSILHRNGTDRLLVRWAIRSRRVEARIAGKYSSAEARDALLSLQPLVAFSGNGTPARGDLAAALARQRLAIEIPHEIGAIEREDAGLARKWRLATRWAFIAALNAGFVVSEFCRDLRGQQGPGAYLLEKDLPD